MTPSLPSDALPKSLVAFDESFTLILIEFVAPAERGRGGSGTFVGEIRVGVTGFGGTPAGEIAAPPPA